MKDCEENYLREKLHVHSHCYEEITFHITNRISESIPLYSTTEFQSASRSIVLLVKEKRNCDALDLMARYLYEALVILSNRYELSHMALLPVPSRFINRFRRGFSHLDAVIERIISLSNKSKSRFSIRDIESELPVVIKSPLALKYSRKVFDQRGLRGYERMENMNNSMFVKSRRLKYSQVSSLIVIDDVMTTGASMREAMRALTHSGFTPSGGVSFAATYTGRNVKFSA